MLYIMIYYYVLLSNVIYYYLLLYITIYYYILLFYIGSSNYLHWVLITNYYYHKNIYILVLY